MGGALEPHFQKRSVDRLTTTYEQVLYTVYRSYLSALLLTISDKNGNLHSKAALLHNKRHCIVIVRTMCRILLIQEFSYDRAGEYLFAVTSTYSTVVPALTSKQVLLIELA